MIQLVRPIDSPGEILAVLLGHRAVHVYGIADVELSVIRELATAGMTMVIATHEMGFARDVARRVCFMHEGRILEAGPPRHGCSPTRRNRARASSSRASSPAASEFRRITPPARRGSRRRADLGSARLPRQE